MAKTPPALRGARTLRAVVLALALGLLLALVPGTAASAAEPTAPAPGIAAAPLPSSFQWGVSSSAFQSEGGAFDSNWTRYIAKGGKDPLGTSVDFRHRYPQYIALAKKLGVKVFRIGIDWSRLEQKPGVWSRAEQAYYDDMIATIVKAGMRPMITLDHWTYPGWEADRGGWGNAAMVGDWTAYAKRVVDRYAKYDPQWITFNEAYIYQLEEINNGGLSPVQITDFFDRVVAAHKAIYTYIHQVQPKAMVSSNVVYLPILQPVTDALFLSRIGKYLDFVGLDYYYSANITNPISFLSILYGQPWTAQVDADGIYYALRHYARLFPDKPLYVTENGMGTNNGQTRDDKYGRTDLMRDTVYWMQRARADGMDVVGYNYWSLTDNYEWGTYAPRFGLYTVDVLTDPTLTLRATDAVPAFTSLVKGRGVTTAYRPTRAPQACSLVQLVRSCLDPVRVK